ncbi:hypothetical protein QBC34DRAFT_402836 [Podospora aff. communis PSN243]|uniref:RGS domain-containing protein n=1 Tax=Podospora aff. communis PSN243 TaxID=3040156 RepID=A0AAV9GQM1_9PEZI|nr:hypothetical protein QBC34DRAFT_402836 [Podospora aff. communis PSN243]
MEDFESALGRSTPNPKFIPDGLSFDAIIKNETPVPCSLNDFMDYLVYVQHQAEDLQFYLWYINYIPRWKALSARQKALSPAWEPGKAIKGPKFRLIPRLDNQKRSEKMAKVLTLLKETDVEEKPDAAETAWKCPPIKTSFSPDDDFARPGTPPPQKTVEPPKPDWFTVQPFRNEYCGVVKHYIVGTSPRALRLSEKDREWCLTAAPHTTHPSALLPAFLAVEENLRTHLHPAFIRWIRSNANPVSMYFLRTLGILAVLIGLGLDAILILSRTNRFIRIACVIFWWPGLTVFIAACKSLCLLLHLRDVRELRPWEMFPADKDAESAVKDVYSPSPQALSASDKEMEAGGVSFVGTHARKNTGDSTKSDSGPDPLRKPSMRTFGPKNDYSDMRWFHLYSKRSVWSKILDRTTPVQNPTLRKMQDRTILLSIMWGGLAAAALAVASVLVPSMGMIKM